MQAVRSASRCDPCVVASLFDPPHPLSLAIDGGSERRALDGWREQADPKNQSDDDHCHEESDPVPERISLETAWAVLSCVSLFL